MELSTSDLIQLMGIMVAIITGITSIVISVIALRQNSKIVKESNKAHVSKDKNSKFRKNNRHYN